MKKLLSTLLAMVMVFSLATVAFAEEAPTTDNSKVTFTVKYKDGDALAATYPAETLTFTSTPSSSNPAATPNISDVNHTVDAVVDTVTVDLPTTGWTKPGVYHFTISQTSGSTAGVTYNPAETTIDIVVNVIYNENNENRELVIHSAGVAADSNGDKQNEIENNYDLEQLTVTKTVAGALGIRDNTNKFNIYVTFTKGDKEVLSDITYKVGEETKTATAEEINANGGKKVTIALCHDASVVFTNIPDGVKYTVIEDTKHAEKTAGWENDANIGYTATGEVKEATALTTDASVEIVNTKDNGNVETGVITESAPYILLIAVCTVAAVLFVTKRRRVEF